MTRDEFIQRYLTGSLADAEKAWSRITSTAAKQQLREYLLANPALKAQLPARVQSTVLDIADDATADRAHRLETAARELQQDRDAVQPGRLFVPLLREYHIPVSATLESWAKGLNEWSLTQMSGPKQFITEADAALNALAAALNQEAAVRWEARKAELPTRFSLFDDFGKIKDGWITMTSDKALRGDLTDPRGPRVYGTYWATINPDNRLADALIAYNARQDARIVLQVSGGKELLRLVELVQPVEYANANKLPAGERENELKYLMDGLTRIDLPYKVAQSYLATVRAG